MTYWKDSLLIGVPKIDDQHKKLISAIDGLMDACTKGQERDVIGKTLSFVCDYTKVHFADEEKLMAQYAYPNMAAHKRIHEQFIQTAGTLVDDFNKNGPSPALVGKLNKALVDWLILHINAEDKRVGVFVNSKGG